MTSCNVQEKIFWLFKIAHSLIKRSVHCACIKCLDNKCAARIVRILYGPPSLLSPSYREKWAKCSRGIVTGNLYRSEIISDSRFDAPVREPPSPRTLSAAPRAAQDSVPEVPQVWSGWRSSDGGKAWVVRSRCCCCCSHCTRDLRRSFCEDEDLLRARYPWCAVSPSRLPAFARKAHEGASCYTLMFKKKRTLMFMNIGMYIKDQNKNFSFR